AGFSRTRGTPGCTWHSWFPGWRWGGHRRVAGRPSSRGPRKGSIMRHRPLATVLGALLLTALVQAPASARPLDNSTFTDHFTDTLTDFCDVPGLTVDLVGDFTVHELIRPTHGGEIPYFVDNIRGGSTFTNQATGKSVHSHEAFVRKDQLITDNGD